MWQVGDSVIEVSAVRFLQHFKTVGDGKGVWPVNMCATYSKGHRRGLLGSSGRHCTQRN